MKVMMMVLFALTLGSAAEAPQASEPDVAEPTPEQPTLPGKDLDPVDFEGIESLITVCEGCHGPGGRSTRNDVPSLAGKSASNILLALEQFYYYERHCPSVEYEGPNGQINRQSMCDITNALSKPEADALGAYFENVAATPE